MSATRIGIVIRDDADAVPYHACMDETSLLATTRPRHTKKLLLFLGLILLVPVALLFLVFPLLMEQPFDSVEQLKTENIRSLRVQILNRSQIDGGDDLGPFLADPADYAMLLAPLSAVPTIADYPDARGPWIGDYRILTNNGRRGTIKFYFHKLTPTAVPALRFQIGQIKYEGGQAQTIIDAARTASARGVKVR